MSEQTGGKTPLVKIYGRLGSAEAYQLRDFLHRCDVPFEWIPRVPGVFAAGDVRHGSVKRVASAVGEGAMAIAFVHRYLANG